MKYFQVLYAHFQRIVDIKSLVVGKENSVITSSVDRSIKVWDLNYIFEGGAPLPSSPS